jgi:nicotinamide-nucleotide amidase
VSDLAAQVGAALKAHGWSLATAESCTGGGVAQAITEIAGCSAWFERGFVTYANAAKIEMLGVRASTLEAHGAVSEMTVREMALGALAQSRAQVSVAVSGIAGPGGGSPEKPVGTVWFAWAFPSNLVIAQQFLLPGSRAEVRQQAVQIALKELLNQLNQSVISV